ncbi:Ig-like domain-containing protein [Kutzneria viridogrisea]|uniref:L,D-TPase catalytic domain-containing protein n=2 Tax=Kutzneria TaxID=43356 RepID=W5WRR0_9PSEU|nr:Ig-like domain-containing protein [Kutzneria albida]AHI00865.1 hypothetical protein KALB_7507 [Kutzneria albida DSM 43870]MBA8926142.1 lipoprotein-anchoring transpeptidase ErfK/SrfK [Kutzneria viridogrisea]
MRRVRIVGLAAMALCLVACSGGGNTVAGVGSASPTTVPAAKVSITAAGGDQVNPKTPIVIKATDGTLSAVTVTNPQSGNKVVGDFSADKTTWTSNDTLRFSAVYQVVATAVNKEGKSVEQKGEVHTLTATAVAAPSLFQAPDVANDFGVGLIIGVKFDHDVNDKAAAEKALKVTSTPAQGGSWYWVSKREAHFRPKQYWQAGSTVKLETGVYGQALGDGTYGGPDVSATYKIHDAWVGKADGNTHQLQAFHNGELVRTAPTSMGKTANTPPRGPTPTFNGTHVVLGKTAHIIMDSCTYGICEGQPGYYKAPENWDVQISGDGEFLHENLATVSVQGSQNVSNGCLNLNTDNAKWFFDNFNIGDPIEVTNSGGPQLAINNGHGDWAIDWATWQSGSALHG